MIPSNRLSRRDLLRSAIGASVIPMLDSGSLIASLSVEPAMRFGLVTYLWGRDLQLQPLLSACRASGLGGVELRTTHAHGIEPVLPPSERSDARKRIEASGVELVGLGSNERFDSPDPARLRAAIEATKRFLQLSHDLGGSGVKVKPDRFHDGIDREVTITQIVRSLEEVGATASGLGQQVRLEVHGGCSDPAIIRSIMEQVDQDAVRVCWNSNARDLGSPGLDANFQVLRPFFGETLHVRELDGPEYPYARLIELLLESRWRGWVLLEAHSDPGPADRRVEDFRRQREFFDGMVARAREETSDELMNIHAKHTDTGVDIHVEDSLFASTRRTSRGPILYPVNASGGGQVVRGHPMDTREGEATDHPHHRSLWLAHGDVDGHDFWHDPDARVELISEELLLSDCEHAIVRWHARWIADGEAVLDEHRTMTFRATADTRWIEFDITLTPVGESVTFGDTKEGFFAIRLAPSLKVDGGPTARGRLENSEGFTDRAAWGRRSDWVLAEGPLDGRLVRVRISDHESSFRHPTWWHARTYGLVAANPFGVRAFEGADAAPGTAVFTKDTPLHLRYTVEITAD